jgi:hypothetical protein
MSDHAEAIALTGRSELSRLSARLAAVAARRTHGTRVPCVRHWRSTSGA